MKVFWEAQSIKMETATMWYTRRHFSILCQRQALRAYVSTFSLSYIDTSESLSTYIPGSHANRSELKNKMKLLPAGLHKLRALWRLRSSHQARMKLLGN